MFIFDIIWRQVFRFGNLYIFSYWTSNFCTLTCATYGLTQDVWALLGRPCGIHKKQVFEISTIHSENSAIVPYLLLIELQ